MRNVLTALLVLAVLPAAAEDKEKLYVTDLSTTLADLLTPLLVANQFSAVRASLRWWPSDEFEDGLAHGW